MIIREIHVQYFRSIADEILPCDNLTAIVGANGAGKSSFLRALDLFYSSSPQVDIDDFYNRDASKPIMVSVTFAKLSESAKTQFATYLRGDELTVDRVITISSGKTIARYHGSRLGNPVFVSIRDTGKAPEKKAAYESIQKKTEYADLPKWRNVSEAEKTMADWESSNPAKCVYQQDDGQFFGFSEVGQGYLGRYTRLLFVPAVRDASSDAQEGRGSVLTDLMDLVIRSTLANKSEILQLKKETQERYDQIIDPSKLIEIGALASSLTDTLKTFVPDAKVNLSWQTLEIDIPLPRANAKLVEDDYEATVERTGHGLQRAFIMTMLQHLALARTQAQKTESDNGEQSHKAELPDLVLAIEEPELYQHPSRQRHFARILSSLASGSTPGVANATQVIYATHSPLFVGIDRINQIRLIRKIRIAAKSPKVSRVIRTDLDKVAEEIWVADGSCGDKYTGHTLSPRLHSIMTPWMSEGFFAQLNVLVEGEDDRAAILGAANSLGHDFDGLGIGVIPCNGKNNIDRPYVILNQLGIPCYLVWDSDKGVTEANPHDNHRLLRLLGATPIDWPSGVYEKYACFEVNLEEMLKAELQGDYFDALLADCQKRLGFGKRKHAVKNPVIISEILTTARSESKKCATLETIVDKIVSLHKSMVSASAP